LMLKDDFSDRQISRGCALTAEPLRLGGRAMMRR
jgi:hypothetical protein